MRTSVRTVTLGPVYYSVLRHHAKHDLCTKEEERQTLYARLDWVRHRFGVRIHAFCWTSDDLRLLFEVSRWPAEEFIRRLAWTCSHRRPRHSSPAAFFEDAYRLALLDCQFRLLELVCEIHLTPMAAGLTQRLADFSSSSYRAYRGFESFPWLTTRRVLAMIDREPRRARRLLDACVTATATRRQRCRDPGALRHAYRPGDASFFDRLGCEPSARSLSSTMPVVVLNNDCQSFPMDHVTALNLG